MTAKKEKEQRTSVCGWVTLAEKKRLERMAKGERRNLSQMVAVLLAEAVKAREEKQ